MDAVISVNHLCALDGWLNFLLKVNNKAEKSVDFCQATTTLPPYPALGLAWTAMANNASSVDIATSKAVHSLVNSITLVNVNKAQGSNKIPVPTLPGIRPPQKVAIRSRVDKSSVMLSKVSIKDHPHHEEIIDLTKEIHAGEPKHLRQGKNTHDYLKQAKSMFEASQASAAVSAGPSRPQPKSNPLRSSKHKVSFAQMVKDGKQRGAMVFPPKLGPTNIPVMPRPKNDWQMVQHKKAT